jgi:hypothetical protein
VGLGSPPPHVESQLAPSDATCQLRPAGSRSPLAELDAYKRRMGWTVPWASCGRSTFNRDFGAFTEADRRAGTGFNLGTPAGQAIDLSKDELMGLSAFALSDGRVFHSDSTFDRGPDGLITTWQLLDRAPRGPEAESHRPEPRRRPSRCRSGRQPAAIGRRLIVADAHESSDYSGVLGGRSGHCHGRPADSAAQGRSEPIGAA